MAQQYKLIRPFTRTGVTHEIGTVWDDSPPSKTKHGVFLLCCGHGDFAELKIGVDVVPINKEAHPAITLADLMEILHKRLPDSVYCEVWCDIKQHTLQVLRAGQHPPEKKYGD